MTAAAGAVTIADLRKLALYRLPDFISSYVETGGGSGEGLRRNIDAFARYTFLSRVLVPVTPVRTARAVFGRTYALPFGISAVGNLGLFRRHGDEILAETAREANIPFMLSGASTSPIEAIARIAPDHLWCQLYAARDWSITESMIGRARDAGVKVLAVTVDYPVRNRNEAGQRSGVSFATGANWVKWRPILCDVLRHPAWTIDYLRGGGMPKMGGWAEYAPDASDALGIARFMGGMFPANLLWDDIDRIRKLWPGKLVLKGICHAGDALRAAEAGVDAVTMSNHGGNKLDCVPASLDTLVMAKAVIGDRIPLFLDGGIRHGSDILKAAALGAEFCFVGRAALYALAAGGAAGAGRMIEILKQELVYTQAMIGAPDINDPGSDLLLRDGTPNA